MNEAMKHRFSRKLQFLKDINGLLQKTLVMAYYFAVPFRHNAMSTEEHILDEKKMPLRNYYPDGYVFDMLRPFHGTQLRKLCWKIHKIFVTRRLICY